jgi:hypothetical protein
VIQTGASNHGRYQRIAGPSDLQPRYDKLGSNYLAFIQLALDRKIRAARAWQMDRIGQQNQRKERDS